SGALWDSVVMGLVLDEESPGGPGRPAAMRAPIVVPEGGIRGGIAGPSGGAGGGPSGGAGGGPSGGGIAAGMAGDGVVLRPWSGADGPEVVALVDDPAIRQWLPLPEPYTVDDAEEYIAGTRVDLTAGTAAALA